MSLTILIVGGYGVFGARLVELLEDDARLTLIVAGRSFDKARDFCHWRRPVAQLRYASFDRNGDVGAALDDLAPNLVIDCSGPFQAYGATPYRLIEACIDRGIDYIDLADGADFVTGVTAFDEAARAKNVFVLSGASTCPVLTAAAVRALSRDMAHVDSIRGGIAPSPFAGLGANVVRAIASYAGKNVPLRRGGEDALGAPLTEQMRYVVAPPGKLPLHDHLFSLMDVPDLRVLPQLWPDVQDVWFGAAPVPEILHRALIACAWAVRKGWLTSLTPFAPLMHWAANHLRWGEHRGGMFVEVRGRDGDGAALVRSWHLIAEGDDGPFIPSMAAAAIVQKLLRGMRPASGARAAACDLELADYDSQFAGHAIFTGIREGTTSPPLEGEGAGGGVKNFPRSVDAQATTSRQTFKPTTSPPPLPLPPLVGGDSQIPTQSELYKRLLGAAWDDLPPEIHALHDGVQLVQGEGRVQRGWNPLAHLAAMIMGFPQSAEDIPVSVRFESPERGVNGASTTAPPLPCGEGAEGEGRRAAHAVPDSAEAPSVSPRPSSPTPPPPGRRGAASATSVEIWTRDFGGAQFASVQFEGEGASAHLLCERFGPLEFDMALVVENAKLRLILRRWRAFGVALPLWLAPRSNAYEHVEGGRFHFYVDITHPLIGRIVKYEGWLEPISAKAMIEETVHRT